MNLNETIINIMNDINNNYFSEDIVEKYFPNVEKVIDKMISIINFNESMNLLNNPYKTLIKNLLYFNYNIKTLNEYNLEELLMLCEISATLIMMNPPSYDDLIYHNNFVGILYTMIKKLGIDCEDFKDLKDCEDCKDYKDENENESWNNWCSFCAFDSRHQILMRIKNQ